jgi:hypothetical protein
MQISAPTNFDFKIIGKLKDKINCTYGSLNNDPRESGLPGYAIPKISFRQLKEYVEYSHAFGVKFNYIMNYPEINIDKAKASFLEKLNKIHVDIITASDQNLISFIEKEYPFKICSSVVCKINSLERALMYKDLGCDILCLDHSRNNDLEFIKLIKKETKLMVALLANNICLPECPYREEHFARDGNLEKAPLKCLSLKLKDPALIKTTGFIHPHDVKKYEEAGVDFLKIGGRTKPSWWIIDCVSAYSSGSYKKNSFSLMNTFASENKLPKIIRMLIIFLPEAFIKSLFLLCHFFSNKKVFMVLAKEKNLKSFLRLYLAGDFFLVDDKEILLNEKTREYLLKEIDKFITDA